MICISLYYKTCTTPLRGIFGTHFRLNSMIVMMHVASITLWNINWYRPSLLYKITTVRRNVINLIIIELTVIRFLSVSHKKCFNLFKVLSLSLNHLTPRFRCRYRFGREKRGILSSTFHKTSRKWSNSWVFYSNVIMINSRRRYLKFDRFALQLFPFSFPPRKNKYLFYSSLIRFISQVQK